MEQDCPVDKGEAVAGPPQDAAVLQRQEQLRKTMELLEHASVCKDPNCKNENCKRVRMLLRHGLECQVKYQGGCQLCRRMWALLQIHAKSCQKDNCPVPRCQDLRAHTRRQREAMENRRRQAYQQMLMQRQQAGR